MKFVICGCPQSKSHRLGHLSEVEVYYLEPHTHFSRREGHASGRKRGLVWGVIPRGPLQKPWACFWSVASMEWRPAALTLAVQAGFFGWVSLEASTEAKVCLSKSPHRPPAHCLSGLGRGLFFHPQSLRMGWKSYGPQVGAKPDRCLLGTGLRDLSHPRNELKT